MYAYIAFSVPDNRYANLLEKQFFYAFVKLLLTDACSSRRKAKCEGL